jgi:integrase/recombinase XerD
VRSKGADQTVNIESYYDFLIEKGLSKSTIIQHRSSINRFYRWFMEKNKGITTDEDQLSVLRLVFQKHIKQFQDTASKRWKVGTINNTVKHLKQLFSWMLKNKMIPDNPCEETKLIPEDRLKAKWLTEQQERALFSEIRLRLGNPKVYKKTLREYAIIAFIYFTGARVEELCNVRLSDIQINERSGSVILRGKDKKQRKVDLNKSIRKILTQYLSVYRESLKGEYLFDTQRSDQMATRTAQHIVDNYAKRLNMPELTCHALRHTCLHNLVKAGQPLTVVAEIAGHMKANGTPNIEMTLRYIKPGEEEKSHAMESISWD